MLCDWTYDPGAAPRAAYRGPEILPLTWDTTGPRTVKASESMAATIKGVATVAHWAVAHPDQLTSALSEAFEVDTFPRQKVYGSLAPPGGFTG